MASGPLLMGIDLRSTSCEAVLMSAEGEVLSKASRDYPLIRRGEHEVEQHAQDWWRVVSICARQAIADSRLPGRDIVALAISSQGSSIVPVGNAGEVVRPAISWTDTRAGDELQELISEIGYRELFRITGKRAALSYSLPKMMWLRKHEPDKFEKTSKFLMPHDYLVYRLTGCYVTDHSLASGMLAHDVTTLQWSEQILNAAKIPADMLPEACWAGTPVCATIGESAETLGVSRDAAVVCGGQDRKCAALGAGANKRTASISLATTTAITCVTDSPVIDAHMRVPCFPYVTPRTWTVQGELPATGGAFKWLKDAFFSARYSAMDEVAEPAFEETRGLFFYPHLAGAGSPLWEPELPGVLYGITLSTTAGSVVRSVLEGIAFQIRSNLDVMAELGLDASHIRVFGGGGKSNLWLQVIADVLGRDLEVPLPEHTSAIGACILAGVGAGIYKSAEEGASVLTGEPRTVYADACRAREYDERYLRYKEIEKRLIGDQANGNQA